jgi:hypothetical protein
LLVDCHICGAEGEWIREITYLDGVYGGSICDDPECQREADLDASDDERELE